MLNPVFDNWWGHWGLFTIICLMAVMGILLIILWADRRIFWGRIQIRMGPNRCGPHGLLQTLADGLKMALKEDIIPDKADKILHGIAPILVMFPVMLAFAIIPFAGARAGLFPDLNIGLLYFVAITSLAGIGILTATWASSNKYALFGGMRAIASMVSYELPMVLALIGVALMAGSMSLNGVVNAQESSGWFILMQPLGFLIFFIAMSAECARSPLDFTEADSELGAGYVTEYSGLRFGVFFMTEFIEAMLMSALIVTLFLGGYSFPGLDSISGSWAWAATALGVLVFLIKWILVYFVLGWIKCTLPRLRIDQWMGFAWKALLPMAVLNLLIIAAERVAFAGTDSFPIWVVLINIPACVLLILLWSKLWNTGGGRVDVRAIR